LLNISQKIDSTFLTIFEALDAAAGEVGIPYFIVGATARDMVLSMGYGIDISRATADIDLGIEERNNKLNQVPKMYRSTPPLQLRGSVRYWIGGPARTRTWDQGIMRAS